MPDLDPTIRAMRRIAVVGTTGSGKTTLARRIARQLELPHVELDSLHWDPQWTPSPEFRCRVDEQLSGPLWVVDGNYGVVRDLVWARAEAIVWLDYPLPLVLWRLLRRTMRRVARREELWNENRERLRDQLGRDSLFLWALTTYRRRRREYPELLSRPEFSHLRWVRLRSPTEANRWLGSL